MICKERQDETFQKVDNTNGIYTFLNTGKIQFSDNDIDRKKIQYSNMLSIQPLSYSSGIYYAKEGG